MGLTRRAPSLCRDASGAVAVEFAILVWPVILLLVGILQLGLYQYTQVQLGNALFDAASGPSEELGLLTGNATTYKTTVCTRIRILPLATCKANLLVEMQVLSTVSTTATAITGTTFNAGASNNALLLRAGIPAIRILPFLPVMWAKGSVVFRRP
ncbi:TadE/TadG family type IV pilus assembly protein [Methylobacterium trifolii]|nr:TadE family protein [Methylobacterium trifolii]